MAEGEQAAAETPAETPVQEHVILHPSQADYSQPKESTFGREAEASPEPEVKEPEAEKPAPDTEEKAEAKDEPKPEEKPIEKQPWEEKFESLEKQLVDTKNWANKNNQEKVELQRMIDRQNQFIEMLNKKMDGTWTDEDEQRMAAPQAPPPEHLLQQGEINGKVNASVLPAYEKYGREKVDAVVNGEWQELKNDPVFSHAVYSAPLPVVKLMEIIEFKKFHAEHGTTPEAIEASIVKKHEAKLREKVEKEYQKNLSRKDKLPNGIGNAPSTPNPPVAGEVRWGPAEQEAHLRATRAGSMAGGFGG